MKKQRTSRRSHGQVRKTELRGYLLLLEGIKIGLNQFSVCLLLSCLAHCLPLLTDQTLESSWSCDFTTAMKTNPVSVRGLCLHFLHLPCLHFNRKV